MTSAWGAFDSAQIRIREYKTSLASHPVLLFVAMVLLWVVIFPSYLVVRSKIRAGCLERREHPKRLGFAILLLPVGMLLVVALVSAVLFISAGGSIKGIWVTTNSQLAAAASAAGGTSTAQTGTTPATAAPSNAASPLAAGGGCLAYEPVAVSLTGVITRKTFPGPPGYESVEKGDEPETIWVLGVNQPICTDEKKETIDGEEHTTVAEANLQEFQLLISDQETYAKYGSLVGRTVTVTGTLVHGFTGHHHTTVMLSVTAMEPSAD